jgi:hypothetical protein
VRTSAELHTQANKDLDSVIVYTKGGVEFDNFKSHIHSWFNNRGIHFSQTPDGSWIWKYHNAGILGEAQGKYDTFTQLILALLELRDKPSDPATP